MIRVEQKEKLIRLVGSQYFDSVNTLLTQRGVMNKKGKPYNNTTVSMVLAGKRRNPAIEDAIRTVIAIKEEEISGTVNTQAS